MTACVHDAAGQGRGQTVRVLLGHTRERLQLGRQTLHLEVRRPAWAGGEDLDIVTAAEQLMHRVFLARREAIERARQLARGMPASLCYLGVLLSGLPASLRVGQVGDFPSCRSAALCARLATTPPAADQSGKSRNWLKALRS
jgi:hypothetical protein